MAGSRPLPGRGLLHSDLMRRAPFGVTLHWLGHTPSLAVAGVMLNRRSVRYSRPRYICLTLRLLGLRLVLLFDFESIHRVTVIAALCWQGHAPSRAVAGYCLSYCIVRDSITDAVSRRPR